VNMPNKRALHMDKTGWSWAVGVTTAPRPCATLDRTLVSLAATGFPTPIVVSDTTKTGSWPTWFAALQRLLTTHPGAIGYLIVQDDVVFCRNLRSYLERTLWPSETTALCSPFCPASYRRKDAGWHRENHGWNLVAAQCWAIPPATARKMVTELAGIASFSRVDAIVGRWAQSAGLDCWYHTPSLAQHVGLQNSALGDNIVSDLREAADFVGEEYSAAAHLHTAWTIGPTLAEHLRRLLRPGMRTLECGSGLSTRFFMAADCDHLALEHDQRFAAPLPQVHLCRLVGNPPWYDWRPQGHYDLVLIDGPPADCGGRVGILPHIRELAHGQTVFVFDDTERADDARLADSVAKQLELIQILVSPWQPTDFGRQGRILVPSAIVWDRLNPEAR